MKRCPQCNRRLSIALNWIYSTRKRRMRLIYKCRRCRIWGFPKDFR